MQTRLQARLLAEERAIFRFLDLPPELRNAVYVELLTIREKDTPQKGLAQKYCYPRMLGTCRQIHQEAAGYLLTEDLELDMSFVVCEGEYFRNTGATTCDHHPTPNSVVCYINHHRLALEKDLKLFTAPSAIWPSILGEVSKLHFRVDFCSPPTIYVHDPGLAQEHNPNVLQLNHAIHDLKNFLCGSQKFKDMVVNLDYHGNATLTMLMESIIAPIARSRLARELNVRRDDHTTPATKFPKPPRRHLKDGVAYALALRDALQRQIEAEEEGPLVDKQEVRKITGLKMELERAMSFPGFVPKTNVDPLCKARKEAVAYLKRLGKDDLETFSWREFKGKRHSRECKGRLLLVD